MVLFTLGGDNRSVCFLSDVRTSRYYAMFLSFFLDNESQDKLLKRFFKSSYSNEKTDFSLFDESYYRVMWYKR